MVTGTERIDTQIERVYLMDLEKALGYHAKEGGVQSVALRSNIKNADYDPDTVWEHLNNKQPKYAELVFGTDLKKVPLFINDEDGAIRAIAKARLQIRR